MPKGLTVWVNDVEWPDAPVDGGDELSYAQVVRRAQPYARDITIYRVEYTNAIGPGGKSTDGVLREGESIKVRDGTRFTVIQPGQT